jgi:hypothetical protein
MPASVRKRSGLSRVLRLAGFASLTDQTQREYRLACLTWSSTAYGTSDLL